MHVPGLLAQQGIFLLILLFSFSKGASQEVDPQVVSQLFLEKINQARHDQGLPVLAQDPVLDQAALTQVKYLYKYGRLTHKHQSPKLAKPVDRVRKAKGWHHQVGENLALLEWPLPASQPSDSLTYGLIESLWDTWTDSPEFGPNLCAPIYYKSGFALKLDKKRKRMFVVHVLASLPPDLANIPYPKKAYGTKVYDKFRCRPCQRSLQRISHDALRQKIALKDGKIFFYFEDLDQFKKVYPYKHFAFAADVLMRQQFPCNKGNQLHGSPVHDGYMTQPLKRDYLLKNNLDNTGKSLLVELGQMPPGIGGEVEINLMLIYRKIHCQTLLATPVYASSLAYLPVAWPMVALESGALVDYQRKEIELIIPFEKDKYEYAREDIQPLYDSLRLNRFDIKRIELVAFASVEGSLARNELLQNRRAESIVRVLASFQLDTIETRIQTFENWREFQRDIRATKFEYLRRYSQDSVKYILAQDSLANQIEPLLAPHRKAVVKIWVEEKIEFKEEPELLPRLYKESLAARESLREMIRLQTALYQAINSHKLSLHSWDSIEVPEEPGFIILLYNDLIFGLSQERPLPDIGQLQHLLKMARKRPDIQLGLYSMIESQWRENPEQVAEPSSLLTGLQGLAKQKGVKPELYYRSLYNVHLSYLNHYGSRSPMSQDTETSIAFISGYFQRESLSQEEVLKLANFLVYFRRFRDAAELLRPYTETEELTDEVLFYYLTLIVKESYRKEEGEFVRKMGLARGRDEDRFCRLFGQPELSFQLLRDYYIKQMYCETCE